MSLEEAEPIPDISWAIRVLQPPPEQENVQYGELGWGRETRPKFPSTQHLATFRASGGSLMGFSGVHVHGE